MKRYVIATKAEIDADFEMINRSDSLSKFELRRNKDESRFILSFSTEQIPECFIRMRIYSHWQIKQELKKVEWKVKTT